MKPASTTRSAPTVVDRAGEGVFECCSRSGVSWAQHDDASESGRGLVRCSIPARRGTIGDDAHDRRMRSAPRAQARAIAAMLLPRPEIRIARRQLVARAHASIATPRVPCAHLTDDPGLLAAAASAAAAPRSARAAATITTMPMPQLKVRYISRLQRSRRCAPASRKRRRRPAMTLQHDFQPVAQHARDVVGETAAGDVRQRVHRQRCASARATT